MIKQLHIWVGLLFLSLFINSQVQAATVAVHDPSIIVVYKDANGNSYPENDAGETRTKYYYIFGTMIGAAYSTDMNNWTSFTPSFLLNGNVSNNYYQIFKPEADYAGHFTTSDVQGNLWAPDIIYNKTMKKWCLYFSLSGNEFKSSVILLTADQIEGPYTKVGDVAFGGFSNRENSIGRSDYARVTGTNNVDARYNRNGAWFNDYGVSCIDPSVMYDENGKLWMNYGSWSGGIFLLKLDENTGLRDYNYSYGNTPVWEGSRLRRDPYMGYHIAGGYYVSGEGPYIEYITDKDGVGYYYMFISMGFYSPEGGYTMRVYRAKELNGVYRDVTGNDAVFDRWIFNYGNNLDFGFPIMQNYKWNWSEIAQIAQGHNSVLQDEDGKTYLVYHRKMDNNTAWHNVEVHQLVFNERGWPLAAPFELSTGFGLTEKTYNRDDIAGLYGIITHNVVDYENLASNREAQLYINADGTLTGGYTGTWNYNYANGKQYITLNTNAGTFQGVVLEQVMEDGLSTKTISFTAMNPQNERALWGYRYTNTQTSTTTYYKGDELITVGNPNYDLAYDAYDDYHQETVNGDFEVEFTFDNYTLAQENWHNWAVALRSGGETWYLRADAYSNVEMAGTTVGYNYNWNWDTEYKEVFKDKEVVVKVVKVGSTINVFASVENNIVYSASAKNCPTGNYTVYLGGESTYMEVKKVSVGQYNTRQTVGLINEDGTYTAAFDAEQGQQTTVSGDFELNYHFHNYRNPVSYDNWDNFLLKANSGGGTMYLRADAFALDVIGEATYSQDWNWDDFLSIMAGAEINLNIKREQDVITYTFNILALDGENYTYTMTNTNAPTSNMTYSFTVEEAMVDIIEVENVNRIGEEIVTTTTDVEISDNKNGYIYGYNDVLYVQSEKEGQGIIYSVDGRTVRTVQYKKGTNKFYGLAPGMYILNRTKFLIN